jgi:hypothetical protein
MARLKLTTSFFSESCSLASTLWRADSANSRILPLASSTFAARLAVKIAPMRIPTSGFRLHNANKRLEGTQRSSAVSHELNPEKEQTEA